MPARRLTVDQKDEYMRQIRRLNSSGRSLLGPKIAYSDLEELFTECVPKSVADSFAIIREHYSEAINKTSTLTITLEEDRHVYEVIVRYGEAIDLNVPLSLPKDSLVYSKWRTICDECKSVQIVNAKTYLEASNLIRCATTAAQIQRVWPELYTMLSGGKYATTRSGRIPKGFNIDEFIKIKPKLDQYLARYVLMSNSDQPEAEVYMVG